MSNMQNWRKGTMSKKLIKTVELQQIFGVTKQTVLDWRKEGMPFYGSEKSLRYKLDEVMDWHKNRRKDSVDKVKEVVEKNYPA